jgi:hypothetical protein
MKYPRHSLPTFGWLVVAKSNGLSVFIMNSEAVIFSLSAFFEARKSKIVMIITAPLLANLVAARIRLSV